MTEDNSSAGIGCIFST